MTHKATQSRRALITFATVSDALERSNDFLLGIAPLFGAVAEECAGEIFEADKFSRDVKAKFGLAIPDDVASFLAPRLVKAGLVETRSIGKDDKALFWTTARISPPGDTSTIENKLDAVIAEFSNFVGQLDAIVVTNYSTSELEEMIYDFLLSRDELLISAQSALAGASHSATKKFESEKEYVSARFLQYLADGRPDLFTFVSDIANAVLISEVIIDLGMEKPANIKTTLDVYVDAPLMMDLLDLSGPERKSYAEQVVKGLKSVGAHLFIFDHSVDEIRDNLHGMFAKQSQQRHGPTAEAIRRRVVDESYARYVMQNAEHAVETTGIPIFKNPESTLTVSQRAFFNDDDRMALLHLLISHYQYDKARERDMRSLEIVIAKRKGLKTSNLFGAGNLLLTHNLVLSAISRKFMRDHKAYEYERVPSIIGTLFAALWLQLGAQERIEISRRKLIVACAEAVRIRPEIIARMKESLRKIVPEKAEQFDAMMSQPRFMRLAMDASLGQETYLTQDKAVEAFDKLEKRLTSEIERNLKKERTTLKKRHDADVEKLRERLLELENEAERDRTRREEVVKRICVKRMRGFRFLARLAAWTLLAVGVSGVVLSALAGLDSFGIFFWPGLGLSIVFVVASYFEFTHAYVQRFIETLGEKCIRRVLRNLGYGQEESRLVMNVQTGDTAFKVQVPPLQLEPQAA